MKEFYVAPDAEIIRFVAEENIADTDPTSVLDWNVSDNKDGSFSNNVDSYDKWFN